MVEDANVIKITVKEILQTRTVKQTGKPDLLYQFPVVGLNLVLKGFIKVAQDSSIAALKQVLAGSSPLFKVLQHGIKETYGLSEKLISYVGVEDMPKFYPVLTDPVLVKAELLAAKTILDDYSNIG